MKYILEIKPEYEANGIMILGARDSHLYVTTLEVKDLEELNSDYINEHYGELQDEAYRKGYADGREVGIKDGMCEAWEVARKIIHMPEGELLNIFTECYSAVCTALQVILKYDASEAIEKLKAYEEKQKAEDEIKVGDEVKSLDDSGVEIEGFLPWVVTSDDGDDYYQGIDNEGKVHAAKKVKTRKTGRHFDIASILKEMQS